MDVCSDQMSVAFMFQKCSTKLTVMVTELNFNYDLMTSAQGEENILRCDSYCPNVL